jgi:hypothetical protein
VQLWGWSNQDYYWPWALSSQTVLANEWAHVAVTCQYLGYAQREFHLYVNGYEVPIGNSNIGGTILAEPRIYIGAGFLHGLGLPHYNFKGVIDEVAIHGVVLPPEEILRHYQNGLKGLGYEPSLAVNIEVKPGSDPNSINCKHENGVITVAIITTEDFDATSVDHSTVRLGRIGTEAAETHGNRESGETRRHEEDADGDGDIDLVFHFRFGDTGIQCGDVEAALTGRTFDGQAIEGRAAIRTVVGGPEK